MKVFGRSLLDRSDRQEINFDELVFVCDDGMEITVSVYRAKKEGCLEVRANDGVLVIRPRAANVAELETRR